MVGAPNPKFHHYLSKFYLAEFTPAGTLDDFVSVVDTRLKKVFRQRPAETGGETYYYRYDKIGSITDEFEYETELSQFETEVAPVINQILEQKVLPQDTAKRETLLRYVAHLHAHTPLVRYRHLEHHSATKHTFFASEENFICYLETARRNGIGVAYSPTYADYCRCADKDKFSEKNFLLFMAKQDAKNLLGKLSTLNWALYQAEDSRTSFITSDCPVLRMPRLTETPADHDPKDVAVVFPLSRSLMLSGGNAEVPGTHQIAETLIAGFNAIRLAFQHRHCFFAGDAIALTDRAGQVTALPFPEGPLGFELANVLPRRYSKSL